MWFSAISQFYLSKIRKRFGNKLYYFSGTIFVYITPTKVYCTLMDITVSIHYAYIIIATALYLHHAVADIYCFLIRIVVCINFCFPFRLKIW